MLQKNGSKNWYKRKELYAVEQMTTTPMALIWATGIHWVDKWNDFYEYVHFPHLCSWESLENGQTKGDIQGFWGLGQFLSFSAFSWQVATARKIIANLHEDCQPTNMSNHIFWSKSYNNCFWSGYLEGRIELNDEVKRRLEAIGKKVSKRPGQAPFCAFCCGFALVLGGLTPPTSVPAQSTCSPPPVGLTSWCK